MIRMMARLAVSTALAASLAAAVPAAAETMVGGAPMLPDRNIIENAVNSAEHNTLVAAVKAAGLVETLQGEGPFTVFAPTDGAFAQLPQGTVATLLEPQNKDQLTKVLTYHVVPAQATSDAVRAMVQKGGGRHTVTTVSGDRLLLSTDNGRVLVTDESGNTAVVFIADVMQSNGVIHVIDKVLLPK
jgi:uncharacterized surface protein with fasciclin (FAS1) repeats